MKTILQVSVYLFLLYQPIYSQITRAEDRMARQEQNARQSITLADVKANKITLGEQPFNFQLYVKQSGGIEQIEANRWRVRVSNADGEGYTEAHLPRGGVEALQRLQPGDVVIARIKTDEVVLVLEIVGVSSVGAW